MSLAARAQWAKEAIGPAKSMLGPAGRALHDLPIDVTRGARPVAELTAWSAAQRYALPRIASALEQVSLLPDWSGGFLVADGIYFDWRMAPFRHYRSYDQFYREELEPTWKPWRDFLNKNTT